MKSWIPPALGVAAAVAITSTMDACGPSVAAFSALPLFPLLALFWYWQGFTRGDVGFRWGKPAEYLFVLLHPLIVLGGLAVLAAVSGVINLENFNARKAWLNFAVMALSTVIVAVVTEEGFFRGWLWASLRRAGCSERSTLLWSSVAFASWHWSAVFLNTGFDPPLAQVPVFLVNAVVIGAIWGIFRSLSGSVVVSSVGHGLWNGGAYVFFGLGKHVGQLGITRTDLFGPEIGAAGLAFNVLFLWALWQLWSAQPKSAGAADLVKAKTKVVSEANDRAAASDR